MDGHVTILALERAARIGADTPAGAARQDNGGIIPPLKFYHDFAKRTLTCIDNEIGTAHAYALLGEGLESVFESEVHRTFHGSPARVVTVAPKCFQRMHNKLLNPAEHGDPNIARPRCAKNIDVLRGCVIVKDVQQLEVAYGKLQAAFNVVRVKNTHDPSTDGWSGGYRSLLVNFVFQPGLTWAQLFGGKVTFDWRLAMGEQAHWDSSAEAQVSVIEESQTHLGRLWLAHVKRGAPTREKLFALQGLQVVSSQQPEEPVRMIAELQLVLEPYFAGRAVSHLLFKIARCDTGAMEMVRDFFQEYYQKKGRCDERLRVVRDIAMAVREGRALRSVTEYAL